MSRSPSDPFLSLPRHPQRIVTELRSVDKSGEGVKVAYPRALAPFFDLVGESEARYAGYNTAANFEAEPAAEKVAQPALVIATHCRLRDGT